MEIDWSKVKISEDMYFKVAKELTGAQRMVIASKIHDEAKELLKSYIKAKNPDWDEKQVMKEIVKFLYDIDLDEMRIADGRGDKE